VGKRNLNVRLKEATRTCENFDGHGVPSICWCWGTEEEHKASALFREALKRIKQLERKLKRNDSI